MRTLLILISLFTTTSSFASLWCASAPNGQTPSEVAASGYLPYAEVQVDQMTEGKIQIDILNNYNETRDIFLAESLSTNGEFNGISLGEYSDNTQVFKIWKDDEGRIKLKSSAKTVIYNCEAP